MNTLSRVLMPVCATIPAALFLAFMGATPTSAGVEVWNCDQISNAFDEKSPGSVSRVMIVGTRGGTFSGKVIIESPAAIKDVKASVGTFSMSGARIPTENVLVRYGAAWPYLNIYPGIKGLDILQESPPAEVAPCRGRTLSRSPPIEIAPHRGRPMRTCAPRGFNARLPARIIPGNHPGAP